MGSADPAGVDIVVLCFPCFLVCFSIEHSEWEANVLEYCFSSTGLLEAPSVLEEGASPVSQTGF